jgi:hypothetical protein
MEYLTIKSPLVGEQSSIYFIMGGDVNGMETADFMRDFYNLRYTDKLTTLDNPTYSAKAYGVRRLTLLLEDALNATYGDGSSYQGGIVRGNVIYEHNCINSTYDFQNIYANYKLAESDTILIGSVYNNFYYTGSYAADELYKVSTSGILGQFVNETIPDGIYTPTKKDIIRTVDENKSKFLIKFTEEEVTTNSIYVIKTDLDIIENEVVSVQTKDFTDFMQAPTAPAYPRLCFTIDAENETEGVCQIDLNGLSTSYEILLAIRNNIRSVSRYSDYYASIAEASTKTLNSIVLHSISKRDSGNVTFYADINSNDAATTNFYRKFLGTNLTNPEFYLMYPQSYVTNQTLISTDGNEFWYHPAQDKPLKFVFKTLIDGASRYGDYYVMVVENINSRGETINQFFLKKTLNSNFQDLPFYIHYVNDRRNEYDRDGNLIVVEEDQYQDYLYEYKIAGMDVNFVTPLFSTFEIEAELQYSRSFSLTEIKNAAFAVSSEFTLDKMKIGGKASKSRFMRTWINIPGVEYLNISYFGRNITDRSNNPDVNEIQAKFNEVLSLHELQYDFYGEPSRGLKLTFVPID